MWSFFLPAICIIECNFAFEWKMQVRERNRIRTQTEPPNNKNKVKHNIREEMIGVWILSH